MHSYDSAVSLGGIILAIVVAILAASAAVSRTRPDQPPATPAIAPELLASDLIGRPVRSEAACEIAELVPWLAARAEANAEAEASFPTDDPRVPDGIAENKAACDKNNKEVPL